MRNSILATCLILSSTPAGHAQNASNPADKPAQPTTAPQVAAERAEVDAGLKVTLIDAGAEPRQELRLAIQPGATQHMDMVTKVRMSMLMDGRPIHAPEMPGIRTRLKLIAAEVSENGDFVVNLEVTEMDSPEAGPMQHMLKPTMDSMIGMTGRLVVSRTGLAQDITLNAPRNMDPTMRPHFDSMAQSMSQLYVPMPSEAVGVGGKWKVESVLKQSGYSLQQTVTYTLRELSGSILRADVAMTQSAQEQIMTGPGIPAGAMKLKLLSSRGAGAMHLNLSHVVPISAGIETNTEMDLSMEMNGMVRPISQVLDSSTTIAEVNPQPSKPTADRAGKNEGGAQTRPGAE